MSLTISLNTLRFLKRQIIALEKKVAGIPPGSATTSLTNIPTYADDTAAGVGGLVTGDLYQTATGELRIKL